MEERRKLHRQRSCLSGLITIEHSTSTMECTVRNVSATGALLTFPSPVLLPGKFDVTIERRRLRSSARIVWRTAQALGVAFEAAAAEPLDLSLKLAQSEAKRAALRRRVEQLSS